MYSIEELLKHKLGADYVLVPFCSGELSQWHTSPFRVNIANKSIPYKCAEQYMMQQKALLFGDDDAARRIMRTSNRSGMKDIGRRVRNFSDRIWDENKLRIVYEANMYKFTQDSDCRQALLSHGANAVFVECRRADRIWGCGLCMHDERIDDPAKWPGKNLLGFILTQVRDQLIAHQ